MNELNAEELYFNELGNYGLLSKGEILRLAEKSRRGDLDARNKIITSNLKLVVTKIKEKIYANMEYSKVEVFKEDLHFIGPVRKRDIIEARREVCRSISALII